MGPLAQLATIMGTSIRELEDTYHRWLRRTDEQLRVAFDAYDAVSHVGPPQRAEHSSEAAT